jgi:hypothetical protein
VSCLTCIDNVTLADRNVGKPSIWPFPAVGVVEAGQEVTLRISLLVHPDSARALTLGEEELSGMSDLLPRLREADT